MPTPSAGDLPSRPSSSAKILILVVERDASIRELEAHFLQQAGFAVEFALDGVAALERAQELLPDAIVTEILVPGMDGLALCRTLKGSPRTRHIVVVVFSILAAQGRAEEAGADAFLLKPLAEHRLLKTVRALLDGRSKPSSGGQS